MRRGKLPFTDEEKQILINVFDYIAKANKYIEANQPWVLVKDESKKEHEINPELAEMFEESHKVTEYNSKTR